MNSSKTKICSSLYFMEKTIVFNSLFLKVSLKNIQYYIFIYIFSFRYWKQYIVRLLVQYRQLKNHHLKNCLQLNSSNNYQNSYCYKREISKCCKIIIKWFEFYNSHIPSRTNVRFIATIINIVCASSWSCNNFSFYSLDSHC